MSKHQQIFDRAVKNGWWIEAAEAAKHCEPDPNVIREVLRKAHDHLCGRGEADRARDLLREFGFTRADLNPQTQTFFFRDWRRFLLEQLIEGLSKPYCRCKYYTAVLNKSQRRAVREEKGRIRKTILDYAKQTEAIAAMYIRLLGPPPACPLHPQRAAASDRIKKDLP